MMTGSMLNETKGGMVIAFAFAGLGLFAGRADAASYVSTGWMRSSANLGYGADVAPRSGSAFSVPEMVTRLKDNGLPVAAIADIARVERKTVYSWLDGSATPRKQHEERMWTLFTLLRKAAGGSYRPIYRVWNSKGADGVTLKDLLTAESLDVRAIEAKLGELAGSIERYARMDRAKAPNPRVSTGNPVLDELPVADLP
jgi:hypothetical protein